MRRMFFLTLLILAGCAVKDPDEELDRLAKQPQTGDSKVIVDHSQPGPAKY
jgi:hypothetical protein